MWKTQSVAKALATVVGNEAMLSQSRELAKLAAKAGCRVYAVDKIFVFGKHAV